jgi:PhnB protein
MRLGPHLTFRGDCEQAFRHYARVLEGRDLGLFRFGDRDPEWQDKILHASLTVGGTVLSGADVREWEPPRGFFVLLSVDDVSEAERVFAALADGGEVRMALQQTFWSPRFGVLVDRFGVPWEVSCAG